MSPGQRSPSPAWPAVARGLLAHASPILVAQLSSIGMMLVDTAVLGHAGAADLAAVAIGGGLHVSVIFALAGILQAVAPVVAHLRGARRDDEIAGVLQQGFWIALVLSVPGIAFLTMPDPLLGLVTMDPEIEMRVRAYLGLLAWGLPAALCYRTFYGFCNALGRPRVLMVIGLVSLALHAVLAWGFALQDWLGRPLGVVGCAVSNITIGWSACAAGMAYLHFGPLGQRYRPLRVWRGPDWARWRELLRLGLPMGFSNLVEITAFTLIALFIAPLGAEIVAGHRIVANLATLCYMLPLSISLATLAAVGQAMGARDLPAARVAVLAGLSLGAGLAVLAAASLWFFADPVVAAYTDSLAVRRVALALIPYIVCYQFFDALQTVSSHALRACRVTFLPMVVQIGCFWGLGLGGGAWLAYRGDPPLGVAGFWLAAVGGLVGAILCLGPLLHRILFAPRGG